VKPEQAHVIHQEAATDRQQEVSLARLVGSGMSFRM
jgi:hypothetical protein